MKGTLTDQRDGCLENGNFYYWSFLFKVIYDIFVLSSLKSNILLLF